jgi:hypothetical protein
MDTPIYIQWQQWESRIQDWLNQSDNELELLNINTFDRVILTVLTIKYQVLYEDLDKTIASTRGKKHGERMSTIKLSKTKSSDIDEEKERYRDRKKIFDDFTGRLLSPEQVMNETSAEWKEFNQLCDWHGLTFMKRFDACLRRFISELISTTPPYQKLIQERALISPATKIDNEIYETKNDGQIFLSVDIKSANFALLQYINAINVNTYPTWSHFLSSFVGSRPCLTESKIIRMHCLGNLPQYSKLEALWAHYTGTIYRKILCPCLDEKDLPTRCMCLTGDEVAFHLQTPISEEQVIDLMDHIQKCLTKESPIVKFHVQAYRLRKFHWKNKDMCFARMFFGQGDNQFDLKCVPFKNKNYEEACADFTTLHL